MFKENTAQPGIYSENNLVFIICGGKDKHKATLPLVLAAKYGYGIGVELQERGTTAKGTRIRWERIESISERCF